MSRLKGNKTPLLSFKIGAASAFDFGADVVSVEFTDGEGSPVTMSDYASGVSPVQMNVTFVLDFAADASYEYLYANAGTTSVTYVFQPETGSPSQTNPKFTGTATLPAKPRFSVEAGTEDTTYDVEIALDTWTKAIA